MEAYYEKRSIFEDITRCDLLKIVAISIVVTEIVG